MTTAKQLTPAQHAILAKAINCENPGADREPCGVCASCQAFSTAGAISTSVTCGRMPTRKSRQTPSSGAGHVSNPSRQAVTCARS